MSKSILKPVDTNGRLIPFLDYRIMQHEACIKDLVFEADETMEKAAILVEQERFGEAHDKTAKVRRNLDLAAAHTKALRELQWVQQHPKFQPETGQVS